MKTLIQYLMLAWHCWGCWWYFCWCWCSCWCQCWSYKFVDSAKSGKYWVHSAINNVLTKHEKESKRARETDRSIEACCLDKMLMFNYLQGFDPSQKDYMIDLKSNLAYCVPCQHWSHHIIKKSKEVTGRQMLFVFTDHQRDLSHLMDQLDIIKIFNPSQILLGTHSKL